jgi:hypothetical protein
MLIDDGGLSSDFTVHDGQQTLWIGVRPTWDENNQPSKDPVIQICYQNGNSLQGPVFLDKDTWDQAVHAVDWRWTRRLPWWKQVLKGL